MLNFNMSAVDFVTAFAILSSGNSFRKIYLFAKFANLNNRNILKYGYLFQIIIFTFLGLFEQSNIATQAMDKVHRTSFLVVL